MTRFLPVLAVSACVAGPADRSLTVRQIVENARALDGKEVVVSGWMERCDRLSCGIFASAEEMKKDFPYYLYRAQRLVRRIGSAGRA